MTFLKKGNFSCACENSSTPRTFGGRRPRFFFVCRWCPLSTAWMQHSGCGWLKFHDLCCLTHHLHMLHSYIPSNPLPVKDSVFVWTPHLNSYSFFVKVRLGTCWREVGVIIWLYQLYNQRYTPWCNIPLHKHFLIFNHQTVNRNQSTNRWHFVCYSIL